MFPPGTACSLEGQTARVTHEADPGQEAAHSVTRTQSARPNAAALGRYISTRAQVRRPEIPAEAPRDTPGFGCIDAFHAISDPPASAQAR